MQAFPWNDYSGKSDVLIGLCHLMKEGAVILSKETGKAVFCNHAWVGMFGRDEDDSFDLVYIEQLRWKKLAAGEITQRIKALENSGSYQEEVEFLSSSGRPFWGQLSVMPFAAKKQEFYLIIVEQIDSIKEREMRIDQDKNRFDALLEHASMGILEINARAEIVNINHFALSLFGYTREEILYRKIEQLIPARFHEKHVGHRENYIDHPKNRPMGVGLDLFAIRKDGKEFPVEVSLSNYVWEKEHYVIAFVNNISIRKKAETDIRKLYDQLEETVEQRTKELKYAIHQLELSKEELSRLLEREKELNELKSRFVSMASHEFRSPLSTVLSSAYLLEQYNTGEEQPKRDRHLKRIISSVNMLTDILNDFLSVGRIEEGRIHVNYTRFDARKLVLSLIEETSCNLKKEQVIEYHHSGLDMVELDVSLLKHIIMNLVSNASKFSPEGSAIIINSVCSEDQFMVSVKDQGIGISPEDQKHLMERFFRGANVTNIQGTGLGLHIVSKYAELMGGTLTCYSELHHGSEFTIIFNKATHEKDPDH